MVYPCLNLCALIVRALYVRFLSVPFVRAFYPCFKQATPMRPALEFYFYADSPAARQTKGTAVAIRHYQIPSDTIRYHQILMLG